MPESPSSLGLDFQFWVPVLAGVLLLVAYVAYYRTTPQVSGRTRAFLVLFRAVVFLLLVLLLLDPVYVRMVDRSDPARVVALVDRSASMALPAEGWGNAAGGSRFETAQRLSRDLEEAVRRGGGMSEKYYFSNHVLSADAAGDSVRPDGQGTDLVASLQEAYRRHEGEHVTAVFVFSDGVETEERLTRRPLPGVPTYTIGIGDTVPPEDVRIKDVEYNNVVRAPSVSPIEATVCYTGRREKRVTLKLSEGTRTIFEKDTLLTPAASEIVRKIPVSYRETGRREFTLEVIVDGEDVERANNRRDIIVEAEKAKATVFIVDLQPEWELHFLTDLLKQDQTYECTVFSLPQKQRSDVANGNLRRPDEFVSGLADCDAVVLISLTESFFTGETARALKSFVRDRGGGLLVLPGNKSLFELPGAWNKISDILPVGGVPPFRWNLEYTSVLPGAQAGVNPITTHLLPLLGQTEWQERSPLLGFYGALQAKSAGEVLLSVRGRSYPAMAYQTVGKGRTAVVSAGPLWRWKFLSENNAVYNEIMSKLMEVLSRGEETNRFFIAAKKNVFDTGEEPVFFAELFNEKLQPVTGVPVRLEVAQIGDNGAETPLDLVAMQRDAAENTRFRAVLSPLPPGRYLVRGQADLADRAVTSRPLEIRISPTSVEYQHVQQDRAFLSNVARRSGAVYADAADAADLFGRIDLEPRSTTSVSETKWRTSFLLFVVIVGMLSAEWLVRKRAGMI